MSGGTADGDPRKAERMFFDVDCNLTLAEFDKLGVEATLQHARAAGVDAMVVPGSDVASSRAARELAIRPNRAEVRIFYAAGVHPFEARGSADDVEAGMAQVRELAADAVAIGECGLDFVDGFPPAEEQHRWFEAQVSLACELGKPLFLHERLAHEAFVAVLDKYRESLPPVLVHCFTGTAAELQAYIDRGYFVSVSGIICREELGKNLREALASVRPPLDRIMVETDAPYLGFPGCQASLVPAEASAKERKRILKSIKPNVPAALPLVVDKLAATLGTDVDAVAAAAYDTATRFFGSLRRSN